MDISQEGRDALHKLVKDNCTVVLVEPRNSGNIGSAARAMKNMGLRRLKLVRPAAVDDECRKMAVGAFDIIEKAAQFDSFDEALQEESLVIGTTSNRGRMVRRKIYSPREIIPVLWTLTGRQRTAVVFGPERRGLSQEQLAACQYLISIPSAPSFPTLNLAQSVLVFAYELYNFEGGITKGTPSEIATYQEREEMFDHMQAVLLEIGFLDPNNPDHIMRSIRRFLGKADLSPRDIRILRGIMSQMEWYTRPSGGRKDRFSGEPETN